MGKITRSIFLLISILLTVASLSAQEPGQPKLILTIAVDPLSPEWIKKNQSYFGSGGLNRLYEEGLVFNRASVNHSLANRSSSVATISSGAPPSTHGIVGTSWYDRLKRDEVYCTEDYQSTDFANFNSGTRHSSHRLLVTTVGDQIYQRTNGKVISASLEPDAAILGGGHQSDGTYWLDSQTGHWTSNSRFIPKLPQWVIGFNIQNLADQLMTENWDLLIGAPYGSANPDNSPFEIGLLGDYTAFPYRLNRMKRNTTDGAYEVIRHTPAGNKLLTEFAIQAIEHEKLGQKEQTDWLFLTYSSFSKIISLYGPESQEAADAIVRLDMEIQNLLFVLEESLGKENVLVVFTATHGSSWNVNQAMNDKLPSGKFRVRNAIALLNSYLSAIYGENYWIESYINQQIYLDQTAIDKNKIPIIEIQEQAARFLIQFRGVANAYSSYQLNALQLDGQSDYPVLEGFHTKRSGDIIIQLQPGWVQDGDFVSDHLSPYAYDQQIPLIFWGYGISAQTESTPIYLKNIAPTLCDLCELTYPNGCRSESFYDYLRTNLEKNR